MLNRSWMPVHVTTVYRALCMIYRGNALVVAPDTLMTHDFGDWTTLPEPPTRKFVRTGRMPIPVPEVILVRRYSRVPALHAPFTRPCAGCDKPCSGSASCTNGCGPDCAGTRAPSPVPACRLGAFQAAPDLRPGTPLWVEYSKCSASPGRASAKIACAAMAASEKPERMSFSLPG